MLSNLATRITNWSSRPVVFATIIALSVIWILSGHFLKYSELWHSLMDIPTTLLSFVMYFIILHRQNIDSIAMQAKLDELIAATDGARDDLTHLEDACETEIKEKRL